jgi:hypothetical protein
MFSGFLLLGFDVVPILKRVEMESGLVFVCFFFCR